METMEDKGFTGSIEYDEEYSLYHGKLLDFRDLVLYEGETLEKLKDDFHEAIDRYIELRERLEAEKKAKSI
ncbi:MAG: hypothetical protein IEMM0008_1023 [bacterium]|nr:MAG: hypothetical protein IEMM0008_1023 [bacterium]